MPVRDLRAAISHAARGGGLNDLRRALTERAAVLDKRGWIPDNWREDGTLRDERAVWSGDEQRETWGDKFVALEKALGEDDDDGWYYVWVQDMTDTEVIYCKGGDLFSAPYTIADGGAVTIGEPTLVRPVTEYVPLVTGEREQTAARPLVEWRRAKVANLKGLERRTFPAHAMELREIDADTWNLTGFACVYDTPYDMGFYVETVRSGAGRRTLGESPDVQLLINHTDLPLARTLPGTLRLEERAVPDMPGKTGLFVDADLDKQDPDAQRLQRKMARRDLDAMSFAFQVTDQEWSDDYSQRTIKTYSLHRGDVSVVNQGANPATFASIRSRDALAALSHAGPDVLLAALREWRDHTLLTVEDRAGKALSSATMETLTNVLNLVSVADDSLDEAQPLLAELMGVPNPDDPESAESEPDATDSARLLVLPDYTTRAQQRLAMLRRTGR
jgi:HK97 family phage prohead protease